MALANTRGDSLPVHGETTPADVEAHTPGLLHNSETPRASEETNPIVRSLLAALAVGLGFAAICWGIGGMFFTDAANDSNDFIAASWTLGGGVCFFLAGIFIWRDSLPLTGLFAVGGLICGLFSTGWM